MKQVRGAPYDQNAKVTCVTEPGDDRRRLDLIDTLIVVTPDIELLLPENPPPGKNLSVIAVVEAAVENLDGSSIRIPAGSTLALSATEDLWYAANGKPRWILDESRVLGDPGFQVTDPPDFVTVLSIPFRNSKNTAIRVSATASFLLDLIPGPRTALFRIQDSLLGTLVGSSTLVPEIGGAGTGVAALSYQAVFGDPQDRVIRLQATVGGGAGRLNIRPQLFPNSEHATLFLDEFYR